MPSRAVLRVALLRGLLLAAAFAAVWPVANHLAYGSARELLSHPDPARRASALELIDVTDDAPDVDEMRRTRAALARRVEVEPDPALRERALAVLRHGGAWGRGW